MKRSLVPSLLEDSVLVLENAVAVEIEADDSRVVDVVGWCGEAGTAVVGITPLRNVSKIKDWDSFTKSLRY